MGQVIPILNAAKTCAADPNEQFIDECYDRLVAAGGFSFRPGQKQLSKELCRAYLEGQPLAVEAPTGTGKTIAYLIGAIAAAEALRTTCEIPVVVAPNTVGLQSQILTGDIPRLVAAGILASHDSVLTKGRSRYFCAASAERVIQTGKASSQTDFFDTDRNVEAEACLEAQKLLDLWDAQAWDGDRDTYPGQTPRHWSAVAAASETCVGHRCDHYRRCPFFSARRAMSSARVIVANHDLVLADLAMAKDGIEPLFPGGRYLVVFDEAHHLPDKALDVATAGLQVTDELEHLPRISGLPRIWQKHYDIVKVFDKAKLDQRDFDSGLLSNALAAVRDELALLEYDTETCQIRFPAGELPPGLLRAVELSLQHCQSLATAVQDATSALKSSNLPEKSSQLKAASAEALFGLAAASGIVSRILRALRLLLQPGRAVRWAYGLGGVFSLHTCPLEGSDVLRQLLWDSPRARVGLVSATLQDFEGFDRFKARCGAGEQMRTLVLPHIFPYRESTLYLVATRYSPRQEEKEDFVKELLQCLPSFINPKEGTLLLFPSRAMMKAIVPTLEHRFPGQVLAQHSMGIKQLIAAHRRRVDEGQGSLLCGLATLAEGLDLPGAYCTHVVICALPFSVPTTPVEQELQEVLGKHYFSQRALPDTLVRLVQMVGRLLRRETDRGRITVFDKRLVYSKWGLKMLGALPPFKRRLLASDEPPSWT